MLRGWVVEEGGKITCDSDWDLSVREVGCVFYLGIGVWVCLIRSIMWTEYVYVYFVMWMTLMCRMDEVRVFLAKDIMV